MTSPTDLAERLREIRDRAMHIAEDRVYTCDALHVSLGQDIMFVLNRLSALESAASGAVTDEDAMKKAADAWGCAGEFIDALVGAFAARYPELSPHRDELNERLCKLVAATITASKHSPRLAKAEQRRVVCPSCGVAFDRSSKWARDASSEPAPSDGAERMARDDAKKAAEK